MGVLDKFLDAIKLNDDYDDDELLDDSLLEDEDDYDDDFLDEDDDMEEKPKKKFFEKFSKKKNDEEEDFLDDEPEDETVKAPVAKSSATLSPVFIGKSPCLEAIIISPREFTAKSASRRIFRIPSIFDTTSILPSLISVPCTLKEFPAQIL